MIYMPCLQAIGINSRTPVHVLRITPKIALSIVLALTFMINTMLYLQF
jgi:hypothetical protein